MQMTFGSRSALGLLACLCALGAIPVNAQAPSRSEIVVTASGAVNYVPDRASVILEVRSDAPTPQEAAAKNAAAMTRLLARLEELEFPSHRIVTVNFAVTPNLRYESGTQTLLGYVANNTVTLRFDSTSVIGRTVDAALAAGATGIRTVRFEASDYERLRQEALQRAVATARRDAEAIAAAAGGTLGDLLQVITDPRTTSLDAINMSVSSASVLARPADTPISAGEQTLTAQVQTRWVLVKAP